jgi:hypothetical protein
MEAILKSVEEETAADSAHAEEEWRKASRNGRLSNLRASPSVNFAPSADERTIEVRYVTRASDRSETRVRLYQKIFELLRQKASAPSPPATEQVAEKG